MAMLTVTKVRAAGIQVVGYGFTGLVAGCGAQIAGCRFTGWQTGGYIIQAYVVV